MTSHYRSYKVFHYSSTEIQRPTMSLPSILISNVSQPQAFRSGATWGYPEGISHADTLTSMEEELIHPHWQNYPPVNPMWNYLLGVIFTTLGLLSFFGNTLVMYLFMAKKLLRSPANMIIVNLAFADFMMMVTQYPVVIYNCFAGGIWSFGPLGCKLHAFTGAVTGVTALLSLVAIGYDRYLVIVKAFDGKHMTSSKAFLIIIFCWIYAMLMTSLPFFGWGAYIPEGTMISCSFDYLSETWSTKAHGLLMFIMYYCCPMIFIMYFYFQIVNAIRKHENALRAQAKKMNVENLRSNADMKKQSQEVRVAKVAVANVGLWLITWTPYSYIVLMAMFNDKNFVTPLVSCLPGLILKTASCYNPVMYAISHPKFRLALQDTLPWFCIHEPTEDDTKSTKTDTDSK